MLKAPEKWSHVQRSEISFTLTQKVLLADVYAEGGDEFHLIFCAGGSCL
jgi:hypothetical protein